MTWLTAFLDLPATAYDAEVAYWCAVTGYAPSASRGEHDQFATLQPASGDAQLRVQRLDDGPARVHLDVHVSDPDAAAERVSGLGGRLTRIVDDVPVLRSPGGFVFCLVDGAESRRPPAARWGGHTSLLDQVCLDIPAAAHDVECAFWGDLLGLELRGSSVRAELHHLVRRPGEPLRLLLQRLEEPDGPVRAHLDLATDDRHAEVARHVALGGRVVRRTEWWTTLRDPAGLDYCVTGRDPETGMTP